MVLAFGTLGPGFLLLQLHWETWLRFTVWLVVGLAIYFFYGRKHSLMNPHSSLHGDRVVLPHGET